MKWSNEEVQFLLDNHNNMFIDELSEKLHRTQCSIYKKCKNLNIPIKIKHTGDYKTPSPWTQEEIDFIKENYTKYNNAILSYILKTKSIKRIKNKIKELNLNEPRNLVHCVYFSPEEIDFIKNNYETMSDIEIANYINKNFHPFQIRTTKSIYNYRVGVLKLKRKKHIIKKHKENHWSEEEIKFLIDNFHDMTIEELCIALKRTKSAILNKCGRLNLKSINFNGINGIRWSTEKINYLKDNFDKLSINKISFDLQIPVEKILSKAFELDLVYITKQLTDPELFIKKCLEQLNLSFYCQKKIDYMFYNKKRFFLVDFIINNHYIIEVQGDYWHCNPNIYTNGPINVMQINNINNDNWKKEKLINMGYEVIYIWENDIKNEPQKIECYLASLFGNK